MNKNNKRGFTLIELLATIVIISVVFGIGYTIFSNVIDSSKESSVVILETNLKRSAELYSQEYVDEVYWDNGDNGNQYACVLVDELVNKGYLKSDQVEDYIQKSVVLTRNKDYSVVSIKIDDEGKTCGVNDGSLKNLKVANFCNYVEYTGEEFDVSKLYTIPDESDFVVPEDGVTYQGTVVSTYKNAGIYNVTVKKGNDSKTIACRVRKAIPSLVLTEDGGYSPKVGDTLNTIIESNVDGTIIAKSSNNKFVSTGVSKIDDVKDLVAEEDKELFGHFWSLDMKMLADRVTDTYITVTLKPNDINNYESTDVTYTVANVEKIAVPLPTDGDCRNSIYNGTGQYLVNSLGSGDGYYYINPKLSEGDEYVDEGYQVKARLLYGYVWENMPAINNSMTDDEKTYIENNKDYYGTTKDYVLTCHLQPGLPGEVKVKLNMDGGTLHSSDANYTNSGDYILYNKEEVVLRYAYDEEDIILPKWNDKNAPFRISKDNYHALTGAEWKKITKNGVVTYSNDTPIKASDLCNASHSDCEVTLIVNWAPNDYIIHFNGNGHTSGSMENQPCAIDEECKLYPNQFKKTQAGFKEWDTKNDGTGQKYSDKALVKNLAGKGETVNLYVTWENAVYYIKFNANGGTGTMSQIECVRGVECELPDRKFSKTGNSFLNWKFGNSTYVNKAKVKNLVDAGKTAELFAQWKPNVCTITYNANGGKLGAHANDVTQTLNYGSSTGDMRNANGGYYSATRTGYHIDKGSAWVRNGSSTTYNQDSSYTAQQICPNLGTKNESVILKVNWKVNVCTIHYNPSDGKFKKNSKNTKQTINYGAKIDNMRNTTGSGGYYNATRSGYSVTGSKAWISSYQKKKYDQSKGYAATSLCPTLKSGDQTVTLYVNWWRYLYKKCNAGKPCAAAGCASPCTKQVHAGTYNTIGTCQSVCNGYSNGKCKSRGSGYACYLTTSCGCNAYNYSASACGCASWGGWKTSSCTVNANTCQRTQQFARAQ